MTLLHKKILLGVSGSIAAYKSPLIVRLLKKLGAEVRVITTTSALDFVTPITLSTLSENPVYTEFIKNKHGEWVNHVELALWADHIIVAPATANTIANMANGICNDLLSAIVLSARCKISIAPAMDLDMWLHPATQRNIKLLKNYDYQIIEPNEGELASGLIGKGRMAEPQEIVDCLNDYFAQSQFLQGKSILITAGPTQEKIDPVRYISNHSSGKMGFAIAEAAAALGAHVILVSGPTNISLNHPNIKVIKVVSADEMHDTCMQYFQSTDVAILAAAVADYKPLKAADYKIKKSDHDLNIALQVTKDIALELGKIKRNHQLLVGFALETNNELENARLKLQKKKFDIILLNSTQDKGATFGSDFNKITLIDKDFSQINFSFKPKKDLAFDILLEVKKRLDNKND
jgi:phosphopantothenoylcysteine decarboxylase/phosphopantothenate--cysteine ligase